jgi:hypothetical protein
MPTTTTTSATAHPTPPLVAALGGVCHSLRCSLSYLCVEDPLALLLLDLHSIGAVVLLPNDTVGLGMVVCRAVPTLEGPGNPACSAVHGVLDLGYLH